jgi:hypothetical protein
MDPIVVQKQMWGISVAQEKIRNDGIAREQAGTGTASEANG